LMLGAFLSAPVSLADEPSEWFDSRAVGGHSLRMLSTGKMLLESRMRVLESARRSIYISGYAFGDGGKWTLENNAFLRGLCDKGREGVDVRLLLDSWGSGKARKYANSLRDCGVKVLFFNPYNWGL